MVLDMSSLNSEIDKKNKIILSQFENDLKKNNLFTQPPWYQDVAWCHKKSTTPQQSGGVW